MCCAGAQLPFLFTVRRMPSWIYDLVTDETFSVVARIILTSFFWIAGLFGLLMPGPIVATVRRAELPWPRLIVALMIITELGGSALLITNVGSLGWLGAGWLGVFTFLSIPLGHPFWKFPPPRKIEEMQIALEHLTVIGGLMCATALLAIQQ